MPRGNAQAYSERSAFTTNAAAHHICAARLHELVARTGVSLMDRFVQVPVVELEAAHAQGVIAALIRAGDEAVERD
jgi:hypothetical protein